MDSLAFETLIPKSIVQRYVSLLLEHRRIILCGPSGTGKTYLAQKLAEHLVLRYLDIFKPYVFFKTQLNMNVKVNLQSIRNISHAKHTMNRTATIIEDG